MSFRANDYQQLSLNDKLMNLTERETKALDKSWAKIFADEIFPAIDEERFSFYIVIKHPDLTHL